MTGGSSMRHVIPKLMSAEGKMNQINLYTVNDSRIVFNN
jgi:hypothetical protein